MPDALPRPPYDIGERTFEFGCAVVRFCKELERQGWTERHVAWQLLKSGTSVGANVQEAQAPASGRDFASRAGIALRECRETNFWLRVIVACRLAPDNGADPLVRESRELTAILTTMVKKSRARWFSSAGVALFLFCFLFLLLLLAP